MSSSEAPLKRTVRTKCKKVPAKSVEGWILIVNGVHEEAQEDQFLELFESVGLVHSLHLNLDRRTGYVKGFALLEYKERECAERAVRELDGVQFLGRALSVEWAFVTPPPAAAAAAAR